MGGVCDIQILSEPQNGRPAVTARCSDHKWTSHNKSSSLFLPFGSWEYSIGKK